jgi:hypothetical protein
LESATRKHLKLKAELAYMVAKGKKSKNAAAFNQKLKALQSNNFWNQYIFR